jgi:hypothetical protein
MRLVVKQNESTVSEFQFSKGPIYIGRHKNSQIFLAHRAVSRQHAVIFQTDDGKWMVEDLDSANKTYLNDEPIHKAEIKNGDVLRIIDFYIEMKLENGGTVTAKPIDMEDTLSKTAYDLQAFAPAPSQDLVIRELQADHAPVIRFPAGRLMHFVHAAEAISRASSADHLLLTLLNIIIEQFDGYRVWGALREQPAGPMTTHSGRRKDGSPVYFNEIGLAERITQAIEHGQYMVLPRVAAPNEEEQTIGSAMIAPVMRTRGCFGVLYIDHAPDQRHFTLSDLDYLVLVVTHAAAILQNL